MVEIFASLADIVILAVANDAVTVCLLLGESLVAYVAYVAMQRVVIGLFFQRLNDWHWGSILRETSAAWRIDEGSELQVENSASLDEVLPLLSE